MRITTRPGEDERAVMVVGLPEYCRETSRELGRCPNRAMGDFDECFLLLFVCCG